MQPFKVTFTFSAPVIIDSEYPIHLDGILAWAVMREAEEMQDENPWLRSEDLSHILERTKGDPWVWKCSRLIFTPKSDICFFNMIRRSEPERYLEDLGKYWQGKGKIDETSPLGIRENTFRINTRSGQQRGYQWLSVNQWMEKAEAWGVGDLEAVEHYLNYIKFIGKLGRNGHGRLKETIVEPSTEKDHWRLRALPIAEKGLKDTVYEPVYTTLNPPYSIKLHRIQAKEPLV